MSAYVKKIQFKLHESYGNPLRGEQISTIWLYENLKTMHIGKCDADCICAMCEFSF